METITIPKEMFGKILADVEILIQDIEMVLIQETKTIKKRIYDINSKKINGKTEKDYYGYLKQRGIKIE